MSSNYDFAGWATKNDILCSDGRTIRKNAFIEDDGKVVPLVWNHQHDSPSNVIGHALLKNCDDGVRAYCTLNDTENGKNARLQIENGDINALSIFANNLKHKMHDVIHGSIKEVSLVLAGANPGACIDSISMAHGEDSDENEGIVYTDEVITLCHSDDKEDKTDKKKDKEESEKTNTDETKNKENKTEAEAEDDKGEENKKDDKEKKETPEDIFNSMSEKQQNLLLGMVGEALSDDDKKASEEKNKKNKKSEGGDETMKQNAFDKNSAPAAETLSHSDIKEIMKDIKRYGTLKDSMLQHGVTMEKIDNTFLAHAEDYGMKNINYLFPDAKNLTQEPTFISRDMEWVSYVMSHVHRTPFSRVKSIHANITADEARAKGYIKGKLKKEEVFTLLKRTTEPTTVYKKQKIDRDDLVDITDFDALLFMKNEMRVMLNEELARAFFIGDGRSTSSDDKINEQNIRPIYKDADLYTVKFALEDVTSKSTSAERAKAFIRGVIKSRKQYKGSGNPALFITEDILTDCLLLEDKNERVIYDTMEKLKTALRVSDIITVPVFENQKREDTDGNSYDLQGILVNLRDYNVGADKLGEINTFEQFDIDYNQQKYLMETRCSGAMTVPYGAIVYEVKTPKAEVNGIAG